MPTFSSLLVERGVATMRQVEEALARQVLYGGDLASNLLDVASASEDAVAAILAHVHGLSCGPSHEIPQPSVDVLSLLPADVATRYGVYPFAVHEDALWLAVSDPLPLATEEDLSFVLGMPIQQFAVPLVRIREALARDYGLTLDRREMRLLARLDHLPDPSPSTLPPPVMRPSPSPSVLPLSAGPSSHPHLRTPRSREARGRTLTLPGPGVPSDQPPSFYPGASSSIDVPPPSRRTAELASELRIPSSAGQEPTLPPGVSEDEVSSEGSLIAENASWGSEGNRRPPSIAPSAPPAGGGDWNDVLTPVHDLSSLLTPLVALEADDEHLAMTAPAPLVAEREADLESGYSDDAPTPLLPSGRSDDDALHSAVAEAASRLQASRRNVRRGAALAGWARRAKGQPHASPERTKRRGPLVPAAAESLLSEASTADGVLSVFFEFAKQYFEYAALFVVSSDLAEGRYASGPGAPAVKVSGIGVPLDLPSIFATARSRNAPVVAQLRVTGLDRVLAEDLERLTSAYVLVLPLSVRGRTVGLFYGDHGADSVVLEQVGEVVAFSNVVARAIERLLLQKKRAQVRNANPATPRQNEEEVPAETPTPLAPSAHAALLEFSTQPVSEHRATVDSSPPARSLEPSTRPTPRAIPAPRLPPPAVDALPVKPRAFDNPPPPTAAAVRPLIPSVIPREDPPDGGSEPPPRPQHHEAGVTDSERGASAAGPPPAPPPKTRTLGKVSLKSVSVELPSEEVIAVDPRAPPQARHDRTQLPPVLLYADLVDRVVAGGEDGDKALGEILSLGEAVIPAVFARFPGPLSFDPEDPPEDLPAPGDCGPILRVVSAMRRLVLPYLAVRSADGDPRVRFFATYLLGDLNYAEASIALLPRLFDENVGVRIIGLRSAAALIGRRQIARLRDPEAGAEVIVPIREHLERVALSGELPDARRVMAIEAIGGIRLYPSVPVLTKLLEDFSQPVIAATRSALIHMTQRDFGTDARRWSHWWTTKGKARFWP